MSTKRQLEANRLNAEKSTGPRSVEGKARSSMNALKTGIYAAGSSIWKEYPGDLECLIDQFNAEYHPVTPTERSLVDILIHCEWMLRRYHWLETEVWRTAISQVPPSQNQASVPGHAFVADPHIAKIHRLRNGTQRKLHETVNQLLRLRRLGHEAVDPVPTAGPAWHEFVEERRKARLAPPEPLLEPAPEPKPPAPAPASAPQPVVIQAVRPAIGFVPSNTLQPAPGRLSDPVSHPETVREEAS